MFDFHHNEQQSDAQSQIKIGSLPERQTQLLLLLFFSIAVLPLFIQVQWITGIIVNAILIFTTLKIGFRSALFLAFIPSMAALTSGLLPLAISPIIPFIISANIILISVFHFFSSLNFIVKLTIAAFLKFLFLYGSTHYFLQFFVPDTLTPSLMLIMGWHQFVTAIIGGIVAFSVMKGLSRNEKKYNR